MQVLIQVEQPLARGRGELGHWHTGPARHDVRDLVVVDDLLHERLAALALLLLCALGSEHREALLQVGDGEVAQVSDLRRVTVALRDLDLPVDLLQLVLHAADLVHARLLLLVLHAQRRELLLDVRQLRAHAVAPLLAGLVLLVGQRGLFDLQLQLAALQLVHQLRLGVELHAHVGACLIHQVDGLVGCEPRRDVAIRELGGQNKGRVSDAHAVVGLVARLEATQDADGVLDAGLRNVHLLEAALERGVLLDILPVLLQRGSADAA
mmetsp:Transcript_65540/g.133099  ORF Transcript_65540/g.133099 Transcript_65540/m.133099 type:complete len:266 (+) Transcript_65540:1146-1943(+)